MRRRIDRIDRYALVTRHNPVLNAIGYETPLTMGNPHRLNLARISFAYLENEIKPSDLSRVHQELSLMTAGYPGCPMKLPGFPKNSLWEVEVENMNPFPY